MLLLADQAWFAVKIPQKISNPDIEKEKSVLGVLAFQWNIGLDNGEREFQRFEKAIQGFDADGFEEVKDIIKEIELNKGSEILIKVSKNSGCFKKYIENIYFVPWFFINENFDRDEGPTENISIFQTYIEDEDLYIIDGGGQHRSIIWPDGKNFLKCRGD